MRQGKPVALMQVKGVQAGKAKVRGCRSEYGVEAYGGLGHHAQPDPGLSSGRHLASCQEALEGGAFKASSTTLGLIFLFLLHPLHPNLQVLS